MSEKEIEMSYATLPTLAKRIAAVALLILVVWVPALVIGLNNPRRTSLPYWSGIEFGLFAILLLPVVAFVLQATSDVLRMMKRNGKDTKPIPTP